MKKATKIFYLLAMTLCVVLLALTVSCDSGNGGGGDLFTSVESTLTETVTSTQGFDFTGTWDVRDIFSEPAEGYGTAEQTVEGVVVVTSEQVTMTCTKYQEKYICETQDVYTEAKEANKEPEEGFTVAFDDGNRTITLTATKEFLGEMNGDSSQTYAKYVAGLDEMIARGATVTTNSGRTAIKEVTK